MIAFYPGSFAPPTLGHLDIIKRASRLFSTVYVAVMVNPEKKYLYTVEQRVEMLKKITQGLDNVIITASSDLTANECFKVGAGVIVRGIRGSGDFDYETQMAHANKLFSGIETVYLVCDGKFNGISSSIVNDIAARGGDISRFVPAEIINDISNVLTKAK